MRSNFIALMTHAQKWLLNTTKKNNCSKKRRPKALGKLENIVVETFVILDVSSNVSLFAHPLLRKQNLLPEKQKCFLANSETFDVSLRFSLMFPSVCSLFPQQCFLVCPRLNYLARRRRKPSTRCLSDVCMLPWNMAVYSLCYKSTWHSTLSQTFLILGLHDIPTSS
jgi:hypothetical protein